MQAFDENGTFLTMWPTGYNSSVLTHFVTHDDFVWVAVHWPLRQLARRLAVRQAMPEIAVR